MASKAFAYFNEGNFSAESVNSGALALREELRVPAAIAFLFVTPDYLPFLDEIVDIIRVDGHVADVVGCTASALISGNREVEETAGFSLLAFHAPDTQIEIVEVTEVNSQGGPPVPNAAGNHWISLVNPFLISADEWVPAWNAQHPKSQMVGGLASGAMSDDSIAVFHNGRIVRGAVAVGFSGTLRFAPAVSQGCRPIGEALPVTKAEDNVVFSLGARPAYQALETAFQSLTEMERSKAQGNLFAGLANNEYVDEFRSGDFLIRNILGADPNSGAVVIGGTPRVGQTLQYQLRDSGAADADLKDTLGRVRIPAGRPVASLIFSCLGRGQRFFQTPDHDAAMIQEILSPHSSAGFFANGEIGPVGGRNCVHSYTASCAVFYDGKPHS